MGKEFQKGKSFADHFPPRRPASTPPRPTFVREPSLPPAFALPSLTTGTHLSGLSPPNPPLLHTRVSSPAEFPSSSQPHVECSRHLNAHMSSYRREPSPHPSMCHGTSSPWVACTTAALRYTNRVPVPTAWRWHFHPSLHQRGSWFCNLSRKNTLQNSSICLGPISLISCLNHKFINARASSSHVGHVVKGVFS
jgi:hypothetical protein